MSDNGVFISILPKLELAAFTSVISQLGSLMSKAGADMSKSFDGPKKALADLNAETVKTSNAVADASAKMDALQTKATRSTEARANAEATASERQVKANADVEAAELRLDATRSRNFASQENRMASLAAAQARLDAAVSRSEQVTRDEALTTAKALDAEEAALGRVAAQEETLTAARAAHTASLAAHTDALAASTTVIGKYGDALNAAGIAATGAFAVIGGIGIDAATKFETGMTRMQVAAQMNTQQVQILSQGLLDMSSNMGESMGKLQDAALMIGKAGPQYKNAADQLAILKQGIELSKTEGADLTTVVQQMTTSMSDFSMSAGQAGQVAAQFQTAAANAKRPLEEFVGALHNIEPTAMGILDHSTGLPQVLTLMSQMAGTGSGIDQASQNLNNFLQHLDTPNAPQRAILGTLGIDSADLAKKLKEPNGLINVLGQLREAMATITTGTGDNAVTHLGDVMKNPALAADQARDYAHLSPFYKHMADQYKAAVAAGVPVDRDVMRSLRASPDGMMRDWYTKETQLSGPSQLVKAGINPDQAPSAAIALAMGSQASDRSWYGLIGDPSDPNDEHWQNTQKTYSNTKKSQPDKNGDVPGWDAVLDTNKQKLDELNGSLQKLAIEAGQTLLPVFKDFITVLTDITKFLGDNKVVLDGLVISLGVLATGWLALKASMVFDKVFGALANGMSSAIMQAGSLKGAIAETGAAATTTATTIATTSAADAESLGVVKTAAIGASGAVKAIGGAAKGALLAFLALKPFIDDWDKSLKDHKFDPSNDPTHVYGNADGSMTAAQWETRASGDNGELQKRHDWIMRNLAPKVGPNQTLSDVMNETFTAPWGTGKDGTPGTFDDYLKGYASGGAIGPGGSNGPHDPMRTVGADSPSADAPGPSDTPDGTPSNPVQVQIPGFDPSQYASDTGAGMGLDMGGDAGGMGMGGSPVQNPLEQLKGGGFTLPNIAKVLTTFLMEMALGNPLGHLLTGTNEFGGGDQQGGGDATADIGNIDSMTAGQRKQAEDELQIQGALARYKKAQLAFVQAVTKYGRNSTQGMSAYANLLSAKDNVEGVELHQTDAIASGNTALANAQAAVQQDITDQINVSDPTKYQADLAKAKKIQDSLPSGATPGSGTDWDKVAAGESSGNWQENTGNGFYGGLQFTPDTWKQYGGTGMPQDASEDEQKTIADRVLNGWNNNGQIVPGQGSGAWPKTWPAAGLAPVAAGGQGVAPDATSTSPTPVGGGGGILSNILSWFTGGGGGAGSGNFPQGLPMNGMFGGGGAAGYAGGSLMPGAGVTYTPDWMTSHGFPALFQRNSGSGDATNIPPAIQALAGQFGLSVNDHPDTTLHGGQAGRGNSLNPMGGWAFDFYGPEAQMAALAQYEEQPGNIGNIAQLIHRSPGMDYGVAGGQNVGGAPGQSSYYTSGEGYNVHGDHDHIAFAQMPGMAGYPAGYTDPSTWGVNGGGGQGFLGGVSQGGGPGATGPGVSSGVGASRPGSGPGGGGGAWGAPPTPGNTAGPIQSGSGPGVSVGGGMVGTAESLASTALNAIAPGAGIAAQIGMQELNNVASYVGKAAGIGIEGLQETFSLHSPDTSDGSKGGGGWLGKIAGGLAGGHPQADNTAGTAKGVDPSQQKDPKQAGAGTTNNYNVTNNNQAVNDPQGVATKTNQSLMQYPTTP